MKNSKLIAFLLTGMLLMSQSAWAYHNFFFRSANDITSGTLDPARVSPDTFTLRGTQWSKDIDQSTSAFQGALQAIGTDTTTIANRPAVIIAYDESVRQGDLTALNVMSKNASLLLNGTTGTLTIPVANPYTIIIGTPGSQNVDAFVSDLNGYNLLLASAGLMGLTNSTTAQATFYWKNGSYPIAQATVPAGLTNYFASTAVWVWNGSAAQQFVKNYGTMVDWKGDAGQRIFATRLIEGCSNSVFLNPTIYGMNGATDGSFTSGWYFHNSINARAIGITQKDGAHISGVARYGDGSAVYVESSSKTVMNFTSYTMSSFVNNGTFMGVRASSGTDISGRFYDMAANGIAIQDGSMMTKFHDFDYYVGNTGADQGSVVVAGIGTGATQDISTATVIADGYIHTNNIGGVSLISIANVSKSASGVYINNVHAVCLGANTVTFINVATALAFKTFITNSSSDGCNTFISDAGTGTQFTTLGNSKDGVKQ